MSPRGKKGDVTITTVILIVLGLAVLVMLIVGFTKGWSFFFDLFDSGPSQLQTVAKACVGYAQASLTIDFCKYRLIEVDGSDELVNCRDTRISTSLTQDGIDTTKTALRCSGNNEQTKKAACRTLASGKPDTKIEGNTCGQIFPVCTPADGLTAVTNGPCKCGTIAVCDASKKCNTAVTPNTCA